MRTIEQIRALLITATDPTEREALLAELEQAIQARGSNGNSDPSKAEQLRSQLTEVATRRQSLADEVEQITRSAVDDDGEAREYTAEEAERRGRLLAQFDQADARHRELEDQVRQAAEDEREQRMQDQVAQMRRDLGLAEQARGLDGVSVRERPVYARRGGVSFVKDLAIRGFGPGLGSAWSQACERLGRHGVENHHRALELDERESRLDEQAREKFAKSAEGYFLRQMVEAVQDREQYAGPQVRAGQFLSYRALSTATGAGGEFTPPLFLTEDWIAFLRAGRVVANNCRHFDLPDGTMSINIPKVLTGVSVDVQGTQNTNVSMTDITTAFVTVPVVTLAGAQIISLQLLERSPIHFDEVIWGDLAAAQAQRVDLQVLNGSGANGQMTGLLNTSGINTVTWTGSPSTVAGLMGQLGTAKVDIANAIFRPATHAFATPYVTEWVIQSMDNNGRPLVVPDYNGPFNAVQIAPDAATAEGTVGRRISGLDFYEDANIPQTLGGSSNQSVVVVSRMQENFLYESPVVTRALPQTFGLQMSVLLQLYGYGAFSAARYPTATSVITGTHLATTAMAYNS